MVAQLHQIPELPERLTAGRERDYLGWFYQAFTSTAGIPSVTAVQEYLRTYQNPAAMASAFARYRGTAREIAHNSEHLPQRLQVPVLAIGGEHVFGDAVATNLRLAADHVEALVVPGVGHYLSEEAPITVADALKAFFADPSR